MVDRFVLVGGHRGASRGFSLAFAIKLYQISALWAIWTTWCSFFYDQHPIDNWVNDIICAFRDQFILRVAEAPAMVQWFRVAQDRRASFNSDAKIPEKEFLLIPYRAALSSEIPELNLCT